MLIIRHLGYLARINDGKSACKIKILNSHYPIEYTLQNLLSSVEEDIQDISKKKKIISVINSMVGNNIKLDDTEQNILLTVWKRVNISKTNV